MRMRLLFIILLATAAGFSSCRKNSDEEGGSTCRVTSLNLNFNPDSVKNLFSYDAEGRIIKNEEYRNGPKTYEQVFTYTPGLVTQKEYTGNGLLVNTVTYTLGSNGRASVSTYGNPYLKDSVYYSYDGNGYLIKSYEIIYNIISSKLVLSQTKTRTFTIVNGNYATLLEKSVSPTNSSLNYETTTSYEYYTDKANYSGLTGDYAFLGKYNKRLFKKETQTTKGDVQTREYTYQFDAGGKPVKADIKTTNKNGASTFSLKIGYACD